MRRTNMNKPAVNAAVGIDVLAPCASALAQCGKSPAEDAVFGQAGKFRIERRNAFKQFVVDLWLSGLLGALLWNSAAGREQGAELRA